MVWELHALEPGVGEKGKADPTTAAMISSLSGDDLSRTPTPIFDQTNRFHPELGHMMILCIHAWILIQSGDSKLLGYYVKFDINTTVC